MRSKTVLTIISVCLMTLISSGCVPGPKSASGFTLPDGDAQKGQETYVRLQCNLCHSIEGVDAAGGEDRGELVVLGGEVTRVKTYGQLVTSIINPSHRLAKGYQPETVKTEEGESKMKNYNDVLTVRELIDLVAFLQSKYTIAPIEPTVYPDYPMYY